MHRESAVVSITFRPRSACRLTVSPATASIVGRSIPYSRSPISASPESFSRTRLKASWPPFGAADGSDCWVATSAGEREALELEHLCAFGREGVADGRGRVVDPRLLGQHLRGEEALPEHPLDDLVARLLGLRLHLVRVG